MKKFISLLVVLLLAFPTGVCAREDYITLCPYPFSSHVLGEDLIIYGDTNLPSVALGFYYPEDQGYFGYAKYIMNISGQELKNGYTIKTDEYSRLWPEGIWKVVVQYDNNTRDEIRIPMTKEPIFDRSIRIAEYEDNALSHIRTYPCRGIEYNNNILRIPLEDGSEIRVFSWNNLSPADSGDTQLFITTYKDGYMTDAKVRSGKLVNYGTHTALIISETERLEIFYWNENLTPIQ